MSAEENELHQLRMANAELQKQVEGASRGQWLFR